MRALLVILLLAGFGLWQAWQCTDGMPASPIAGMPAMAMDMPVVVAAADMVVAGDAFDVAADHTMPQGMVGACITVLAGIGAALLLIVLGPRLVALLRRLRAALPAMFDDLPAAGPSLSQLCVSRT